MTPELGKMISFVEACIAEDEWWAVEASRADERGYTPTGEHWIWETSENDIAVVPDPAVDEFLGDSIRDCGVGLRSVEEYPTELTYSPLLRHVMFSAEEVPSAVGGHIIRHDPARAMREVKAKRAILRVVTAALADDSADQEARYLLSTLAMVYREHPQYSATWEAAER